MCEIPVSVEISWRIVRKELDSDAPNTAYTLFLSKLTVYDPNLVIDFLSSLAFMVAGA